MSDASLLNPGLEELYLKNEVIKIIFPLLFLKYLQYIKSIFRYFLLNVKYL